MSNTSTLHLLQVVDALNKHASMLQQNQQEFPLQWKTDEEKKKECSSMGVAESTVELLQWASKQISQLAVDDAPNQVVNCVPVSSEIVLENSYHLVLRSTSKDETDVVPKALELVTKPRRLLLTNGFEIRCLNLTQHEKIRRYESINDIPPLPKTGFLNLLSQEDYPVVVGLFKLDSDAYMVGGQHLSAQPMALDFESFLSNHDHDIKELSRDTYLLSGFAADSDSLVPCKCKIPPLNKPKVWPVIEKIGGLIHVFDSFPRWHNTPMCFLNEDEFSYEVLNPNDVGKGWTEIPTDALSAALRRGEGLFKRHLVVGDHIYLPNGKHLFTYDSKTRVWEMQSEEDIRSTKYYHDIGIERVWHLLYYGEGRCMGEFVHHGEEKERLYMVIAIFRSGFEEKGDFRATAVAYLASSTGRVVCYQRLRHFFVGEPCFIMSCMLFNVDEQEMCSVVTARHIFSMDYDRDLVLINTFVWEAIADAGAKVRVICEKARSGSYFRPVELDFVRVDVKETYLYKTVESEVKEECDFITLPRRLQACFL